MCATDDGAVGDGATAAATVEQRRAIKETSKMIISRLARPKRIAEKKDRLGTSATAESEAATPKVKPLVNRTRVLLDALPALCREMKEVHAQARADWKQEASCISDAPGAAARLRLAGSSEGRREACAMHVLQHGGESPAMREGVASPVCDCPSLSHASSPSSPHSSAQRRGGRRLARACETGSHIIDILAGDSCEGSDVGGVGRGDENIERDAPRTLSPRRPRTPSHPLSLPLPPPSSLSLSLLVPVTLNPEGVCGGGDPFLKGRGRRGLNGGQAVDGREGLQEERGVWVLGLVGGRGAWGKPLHFNDHLKGGERGRGRDRRGKGRDSDKAFCSGDMFCSGEAGGERVT